MWNPNNPHGALRIKENRYLPKGKIIVVGSDVVCECIYPVVFSMSGVNNKTVDQMCAWAKNLVAQSVNENTLRVANSLQDRIHNFNHRLKVSEMILKYDYEDLHRRLS